MRSPLRGTFVPLLLIALLVAAVCGYGSDLSPAASSTEDIPGEYNEVPDEMLSLSEKSGNSEELTDSTDRVGSEQKNAMRKAERDPVSEFENADSVSESGNAKMTRPHPRN